ncbi:MAG: hypothetical protein ABSG41_08065 [Bryobacteraceae bacterium]|jgi:hypothetical protein
MAELTHNTITPDGQRSLDEAINIAYAIHAGDGFADPFLAGLTGPSAHCAPLFPVVTAGIFSVFGAGTGGAIARDLLNMAGYSLLFALLPMFAAGLGMTAAPGVASGVAAALYPYYGLSEVSRGRDEWLAALMGMLLLLYALRIARGDELTRSSGVFFGAGWGALMYVHPAMVTILPIHLLTIVFARKRQPGQLLSFTVISCAVFLLAILPWTIRNRVVMGGWMFMRDDLGLELEVSNGDGATASVVGNFASQRFCSIHPTCSRAATLQVLEIGELEFNRQAMAKAMSWIRSNPSRFGGLTLRRAAAFWLGSVSQPLALLLSAGLSFLGVAGLWLMWRMGMKIETALFGALWIVYPLAFYLIQRVDRYQVPIYPAILLPAGFASVTLYLNLRKSMLRGSKN